MNSGSLWRSIFWPSTGRIFRTRLWDFLSSASGCSPILHWVRPADGGDVAKAHRVSSARRILLSGRLRAGADPLARGMAVAFRGREGFRSESPPILSGLSGPPISGNGRRSFDLRAGRRRRGPFDGSGFCPRSGAASLGPPQVCLCGRPIGRQSLGWRRVTEAVFLRISTLTDASGPPPVAGILNPACELRGVPYNCHPSITCGPGP